MGLGCRGGARPAHFLVTARQVTKTEDDIAEAKRALDAARRTGDPLKIELAEATLNDLLDRSQLSHISHTTED